MFTGPYFSLLSTCLPEKKDKRRIVFLKFNQVLNFSGGKFFSGGKLGKSYLVVTLFDTQGIHVNLVLKHFSVHLTDDNIF